MRVDPAEGFVASANERPVGEGPPVGWFFSSGRRAARMRALLADGAVSVAALCRLQMDVMDPSALPLRDAVLRLLGQRRRPALRLRALRALAAWDGGYGADSAGALVFEVVVARLARALRPAPLRAVDAAGWTARALFAGDLAAAPPEPLRRPAERGLAAAARLLARHGAWGGVHRARPAHHLAAVPGLRRRFRGAAFACAGGNDTVLKTGHGPVRGRHTVRFGAGARHVSDLSDPDSNHFVLFGGQDGWLGSDNAADQVPLWRSGQYVRVPMQPDPACFPHLTVLQPA
jgi:penicillin G amidase